MKKCPGCGFENSDNCTFCAICGSPVEESNFYVHTKTKTADISVEELNQTLLSAERNENEKTRSFTKLDKAALNNAAKTNSSTDNEEIKEYSKNIATDNVSSNKTKTESVNQATVVKEKSKKALDNKTESEFSKESPYITSKNTDADHTETATEKTAESRAGTETTEKSTINNEENVIVKDDNTKTAPKDAVENSNNIKKNVEKTVKGDANKITDNVINNDNNLNNKNTEPSHNKLYDFFFNLFFGTNDETETFDEDDIEENSTFAVFSYIPFLFFIPMIVKPRSGYLRYHGTQGLTMFLTFAVLEVFDILLCAICSAILSSPIDAIATIIITLIINLCVLLLIAIGIANAVKGFARELPAIGKWKLLEP